MSRTNPEIRDNIVMLATMLPCRPRFCVGGICCEAGSGSVVLPGAPSDLSVDTRDPHRHIAGLIFPELSQETSLANSASARKRARQSEKRRRQNASQRSMVRTSIKRVQAAIASGKRADAQAALTAAIPVIDGMVTKGIIHQHKAARHKSRLNAQVNALGA
jgi:small subunit ribosomal protein S20